MFPAALDRGRGHPDHIGSRDGSETSTLPPRSRTDNDVQVQERRPGEGPDTTADDQLREQFMRERARREFVIASLRSHLAEQPNARAVRACARRWISDIANLAADVVGATNQEPE